MQGQASMRSADGAVAASFLVPLAAGVASRWLWALEAEDGLVPALHSFWPPWGHRPVEHPDHAHVSFHHPMLLSRR